MDNSRLFIFYDSCHHKNDNKLSQKVSKSILMLQFHQLIDLVKNAYLAAFNFESSIEHSHRTMNQWEELNWDIELFYLDFFCPGVAFCLRIQQNASKMVRFKTLILNLKNFPEIKSKIGKCSGNDHITKNSIQKPFKAHRYLIENGNHFFSLFSDSLWLTVTHPLLLSQRTKRSL